MSDRRDTPGHGDAGRGDDGLLEHLAGLPADMEVSYPAGRLATLIREEVRRRLNQPAVEWVGTPRAERLLAWNARKVRRRAQAWHEQQERDRRPAVRVRKKNPNKKNSDWEFALGDLRRHAARRNGSPASDAQAPSANGGGPDGQEQATGELAPEAVDEGLQSVGIG